MRFRGHRAASSDDSTDPGRAARRSRAAATGPSGAHPHASTSAGRRRRHAGWTINGRAFDPDRIDADVAARHDRDLAASPPTCTTRSTCTSTHFQVLTRDGGEPGPHDAGWKDTVDLRPGEAVEVPVRFDRLPGRYVLHCHNLEHEDMAMMANFEVV